MAEIDPKEAERHRAKMAKRKAVQDAEVAAKTIEKGLLIVNTGPGKGKSTAAFGLALRMLGHGRRVGVVQFVKGAWHTGEKDAFAAFGDRVDWHSMGEGFTWETQDKARDIAAAERAWAKAEALMADPTIGLVILDELNIALRYDYLDLAAVVAALQATPRRPARRRHRPQRQAGADRRRRPRHRDDPGQAPLRRRREGAEGHRVLAYDRPRDHVPGHRLRRRQIADRRRAGACLRQSRPARAAVQAAEHVEQRRGHDRRRRDRPGAGAAGTRCARAAERPHEPGAAEAAERDRRADRRAGQGARLLARRRVPDRQGDADAARCSTALPI